MWQKHWNLKYDTPDGVRGMTFYQDNTYTVYNKDCRNMNELSDNSIQCVVTSPPYFGLRKYAGDQDLIWGGNPDCEHEWLQQGWGKEKEGFEKSWRASSKGWEKKSLMFLPTSGSAAISPSRHAAL
jgi:DNA modification methylase